MLSNSSMYAALPVPDLKKAMEFYGKVLGLQIIDQNQNGIWYQTGDTRIAIYESTFAGTNQATSIIWEIYDPEKTVKSLKARGITFEHYDDLPGMTRKGDIHRFKGYDAAWFKDPFGNIICIAHHL